MVYLYKISVTEVGDEPLFFTVSSAGSEQLLLTPAVGALAGTSPLQLAYLPSADDEIGKFTLFQLQKCY